MIIGACIAIFVKYSIMKPYTNENRFIKIQQDIKNKIDEREEDDDLSKYI